MENKFFEIKKINQESEKKKASEQWTSKHLEVHFQKVGVLEKSNLSIPNPGEISFLQSDTAFNAFTFLTFVAKNYSIKELYASTYSISQRVVDSLIELHDCGRIERITLLVSESLIKRNPLTIDNLLSMVKTRPNIKVMFTWNHSKICLMETNEAFFVVEGSGNWSENAQFEQYVFANDKEIFDFRKSLFTDSNFKEY